MILLRRKVSLESLRAVIDRTHDGKPAWRGVLSAWREQIEGEFRSGRSAEGVRWVPRQPFADEPGGPSTLQKSGLLLRTWLGGPGSIAEVRPEGVRFGVSGERLPYAAIHREGGRILVTPRMRRFLAAQGRPLRANTRELVIPARPHAAANPEIRGQAVRIYRRFLSTGDTP